MSERGLKVESIKDLPHVLIAGSTGGGNGGGTNSGGTGDLVLEAALVEDLLMGQD